MVPITTLFLALIYLLFQSKPFLKYIWTHPYSMGMSPFTQMGHNLLDLGLTLLLLIGFYFTGQILLDRFYSKLKKLEFVEKLIISILGGEALFSITLYIAGILNFFNPLFFYFLFLVLLVLILEGQRPICWTNRALSLFPKFPRLSMFSWICLVFIAAALIRSIVATCAPPNDWDSLSYHLALPKIYLAAGGIAPIHWAINAHYPLNTEMIYTLCMALRCDHIPHWINLFHGLLLLLLTAQLAKRVLTLTQEGILFCVLILICQPLFQRVIGNGSTDFSVALPFLASFLCLLKGINEEDQNLKEIFFLLSGSLSGISMGAKMTGVWMTATLLLTALLLKVKGRSLLYFLLGVFIFGSPWYLKNWITMGNPIWPYLGEWFNASPFDLDAWHRIRDSITEGGDKNSWSFLTLPLQMILKPEKFLYDCHYILIPFLTLLIAKLLQKERFSLLEKKFLWVLAFSATFWFWTYQNWRYLLPILSLIVLLTVHWSYYFWKERKLKFISLISLFSIVPLFSLSINNEAFVFLNLKPESSKPQSAREKYLQLTLGPAYTLTQVANQILPNNAKILLYKDVRGYYLNRDYAWGDPLNPGTFSYREIQNSQQLHKKLISLGFTHILYNPTIGNYKGDRVYYEKADRIMLDLLKTKASPLYILDGLGLFKLDNHPA